ncbi:unnamed protein product [Pleuronectes platessa]|uniref:Uncharacterized protein n=1 Tax=Pleuronectes platessa TaxID=8262 RepID=A0A9N7VVA3_PLEPL|nr:unnamed protein product [Pleuronectes platessa]
MVSDVALLWSFRCKQLLYVLLTLLIGTLQRTSPSLSSHFAVCERRGERWDRPRLGEQQQTSGGQSFSEWEEEEEKLTKTLSFSREGIYVVVQKMIDSRAR